MPVALPSSRIGGGLSGNTTASRMTDKSLKARCAMAWAESSAPRSFQSFSGTNTRPAFWPLPENEKPATAMVRATAGCLRK